MSSSPSPFSLTDTQADILSYFLPPSPPFPQSPQPSQISPPVIRSPEADFIWREQFLGADDFLPEPELEGISPYFLDGEAVDYPSVSTHRRFR